MGRKSVSPSDSLIGDQKDLRPRLGHRLQWVEPPTRPFGRHRPGEEHGHALSLADQAGSAGGGSPPPTQSARTARQIGPTAYAVRRKTRSNTKSTPSFNRLPAPCSKRSAGSGLRAPGWRARVPHRLAADPGAGRCGVPGQSRCHAPQERQRQRCGRGARARRPAPPPGPMAGAGPGNGSKFNPTSEAVEAALPPGMIAGSKVPLRLLPLPLPRARRIALLVARIIGQLGARRPLQQRLLPLPEEARRRPEGLPASGNWPAIRLEAQVEASSSQVLLHKIWATTRSLTQNIG